MNTIGDILDKQQELFTEDKPKYISQEFQHYGYRLAVELDDIKHKALYIKLAKEQPRERLERAKAFVSDYPNATSKGKIFMWALKKLKKGEPLT